MTATVTTVSFPNEMTRKRVRQTVRTYEPCTSPLPQPPSAGKPAVWAVDHVRAWLKEAMETLARMPMPPGGIPNGSQSGMPDVVREVAQSYGWQATRVPVVRPSADEIDRLDFCLEWLGWLLEPKDRIIIVGVALGLHYRAIGRILMRSHTWVRDHDQAAMARILDRLNAEAKKVKLAS